jgi:hypothetical protein
VRSIFKAAALSTALVLTTGCQLDYGLDVVARDGHVDFHVYQKGFGPNKPASVERLTVREVTRHERTVWQLESVATNGQELSDIQYGKVPTGLRQTMPAEPLKAGQLYVVALNALGGMEIAYFVITPSDRPVAALQSAN